MDPRYLLYLPPNLERKNSETILESDSYDEILQEGKKYENPRILDRRAGLVKDQNPACYYTKVYRMSEFIGDKTVIFVFGSNLAGIHGAGAALYARKEYGAIYGQGIGLQGNSYAIPTKDFQIRTLSLTEIQKHVNVFLEFAKNNTKLEFELTPIGCGLAGYQFSDIAPMFKDAPENVILPLQFKEFLDKGTNGKWYEVGEYAK